MCKNFIAMALLLICFSCSPDQEQIEENPWRVNKVEDSWIICHGGAKALWPENTMMAFDSCAELGVDAFEMDVSITKDSVLVLHHDETIDRMSDGSGKVADFTYKDLLAFNFGHGFIDTLGKKPYEQSQVQLTRLEDLVAKYPETPMIIEIKNSGQYGKSAARQLVRIIDEKGIAEHVIIASFHDEILSYFQSLRDKTYLTSTGSNETKQLILGIKTGTAGFRRPSAAVCQIPMESGGFNLAKKRIVNALHRRNMAVHYWTINQRKNMEKLLEMGADGLITDRPDIMKRVLNNL